MITISKVLVFLKRYLNKHTRYTPYDTFIPINNMYDTFIPINNIDNIDTVLSILTIPGEYCKFDNKRTTTIIDNRYVPSTVDADESGTNKCFKKV